MNKHKKPEPHCLTLRLDRHLDELLTKVATEIQVSKSEWIREAIMQGLGFGTRIVLSSGPEEEEPTTKKRTK